MFNDVPTIDFDTEDKPEIPMFNPEEIPSASAPAKSGNYKHCASGVPSVQFSLLALLDLWKRGELSLETIIKATSENVAARYRIKNRGKIEEGYYADLAIINPLKPHTVEKSEIVSKCGHSPFSEHTFSYTACSCRHIFFELAGGCGVCVYLRG